MTTSPTKSCINNFQDFRQTIRPDMLWNPFVDRITRELQRFGEVLAGVRGHRRCAWYPHCEAGHAAAILSSVARIAGAARGDGADPLAPLGGLGEAALLRRRLHIQCHALLAQAPRVLFLVVVEPRWRPAQVLDQFDWQAARLEFGQRLFAGQEVFGYIG